MEHGCKCDCLNFCGDDPWLKDGRAVPCAAALKRKADEEERVSQAKTDRETLTGLIRWLRLQRNHKREITTLKRLIGKIV